MLMFLCSGVVLCFVLSVCVSVLCVVGQLYIDNSVARTILLKPVQQEIDIARLRLVTQALLFSFFFIFFLFLLRRLIPFLCSFFPSFFVCIFVLQYLCSQ